MQRPGGEEEPRKGMWGDIDAILKDSGFIDVPYDRTPVGPAYSLTPDAEFERRLRSYFGSFARLRVDPRLIDSSEPRKVSAGIRKSFEDWKQEVSALPDIKRDERMVQAL